MPDFKNLAALAKAIQPKIDDVLEHEVLDDLKISLQKNINDSVYSTYSPKMYQRRGAEGGMADPDNIVIEGDKVINGEMTVVNITEPSNPDGGINTSEELQQLIIGGHGANGLYYDYPLKGAAYMEPRDYIESTLLDLKFSGSPEEALKRGLKSRGLKVEK